MSEQIRVLVVTPDTLLRQGLVRLLGDVEGLEVVAAARSLETGEAKLVSFAPEVVVLDLTDEADEALEMVVRTRKRGMPVRFLGLADEEVAERMLQEAVGHGCAGVVRRAAGVPSEEVLAALAKEVGTRVMRLAECKIDTPRAPRTPEKRPEPASEPPSPPSRVAKKEARAATGGERSSGRLRIQMPLVVGIGVSTGGPAALARVVPRLPAGFPLPIVIVQHMPAGFTASLAESLDASSALTVREAEDGERLVAGRVLIAPGGRHLRVASREGAFHVELTDDPPVCSCRPSVDYLFRSLASVCRGRVLALVLTGMGEDGWEGSQAIHEAGGFVIAQDEATSTVYGMPRGPVESGIAEAVPLDEIADRLTEGARSLVCS